MRGAASRTPSVKKPRAIREIAIGSSLGPKVALGGNWSKVKPFVMTSADQFRAPPPPPPPSLKDEAYKRAFKEAVRVGGDPAHGTNTSRTEFQTWMGRFWGYDGTPGLCAPTRMYNMIARTIALQQKMLALPEIARLFALVNVAMADAGIASWDSKFFYEYWRPVTAIRAQSDPNFYPFGAPDTNTGGPNFTPPFPSYTSGHAVFGGALFQILRQFWPDETPFRMNGTARIKMLTAPSGPSIQPRSNRLAKRNTTTRKAGFTWAYIGTSTPKRASNKAIRWLTMFSATPSGQSNERKRAHEKDGSVSSRFGAETILTRRPA